jgi:hypothetical protein
MRKVVMGRKDFQLSQQVIRSCLGILLGRGLAEPVVKVLVFCKLLRFLRTLNCPLLSYVELLGRLAHHPGRLQLILPLLLKLLLASLTILLAIRARKLFIAVVGVVNEALVLVLGVPLTRIDELVAVLYLALLIIIVLRAFIIIAFTWQFIRLVGDRFLIIFSFLALCIRGGKAIFLRDVIGCLRLTLNWCLSTTLDRFAIVALSA